MEPSTLLNLDYLAVSSTVLSTSYETNVDSGTETGSHRSPSDSEGFDGKYEFGSPRKENKFPDMESTSNQVPPPPPLPPLLRGVPPPPNAPPAPPMLVQYSKFGTKFDYDTKDSKKRLRRLNWQKIPERQINQDGATNIWMESKGGITVDFSAIDDLFAVEEKTPRRKSPRPFTPIPDSDSSNPDDAKPGTISLIDSKRSLNVNIFLRQFKRSPSVLSESIKQCDVSFMNSEKLRALRKLLPEKEEIKILKEFKGNIELLDTAERFFVHVINVSYYVIRIDAMLLREEFDHAMSQVEQSIAVLQRAIRELRQCFALPTILHLVLQAGNYLNRGAAFGNAVGFRLASLKTLTDTKANKPGMTLMHYVAMELAKHDQDMVNWTQELPSVGKASRISDEEVRLEISIFNGRVMSLKNKVETEADDELRENVKEFLKTAEERLNLTKAQEQHLTEQSNELAIYLCEQKGKFSLNGCFQIVSEFRNKFVKCAEENLKREKESKRKNSTEKYGQTNKNNNNNNNNKSHSVTNIDGKIAEENAKNSDENSKNPFRRSYSLATPHQRYRGSRSSSNLSSDVSSTSPSRLQRYDASNLRRTSLAKPDVNEIAKLYQAQFTNDENEVKEAWPECQSKSESTNQTPKSLNERLRSFGSSPNTRSEPDLEVTTSFSRRRRLGSLRTHSLYGGVGDDDGDELVHHLRASQKAKKEDLEESMKQFVSRERSRILERTQLRRSYRRDRKDLPSRDDESDGDVITDTIPAPDGRRRSWRQRRSPLASQSTSSLEQSDVFVPPTETRRQSVDGESAADDTRPRRHDDIRERIRKYKTATSFEDNSIPDRRLSTGSGISRKESTGSSCDSSQVSISEESLDNQPRRRLNRRRTVGGDNDSQIFDQQSELKQLPEEASNVTLVDSGLKRDDVRSDVNETATPEENIKPVAVEEVVVPVVESDVTAAEPESNTDRDVVKVVEPITDNNESNAEVDAKKIVSDQKKSPAKPRGIPQMRRSNLPKPGRSALTSPGKTWNKNVKTARSRDSSPAPCSGSKTKVPLNTRAASLSPTRRLRTPVTEIQSVIQKLQKSTSDKNSDNASMDRLIVPVVVVSDVDDLQINDEQSLDSESIIPKQRSSSTNSSPTRVQSRPASRSSGLVTPSTQTNNTMNRAARLRQNKSQQSNISVKPASRFSSPVKSNPNTKDIPKKAQIKAPTVRQPVKQKAVTAKAKPTETKKNVSNLKSPRTVTPKTPKSTNVKSTPTRLKPKSVLPMKETNLSDNLDANTQPNGTAAHTGVQMNRAARLRLLKKNNEAKNCPKFK